MSANLRSSTEAHTTTSGSTLSATHTTQAGDRLLVYVGAMRSTESTNWTFSNVTFDGQGGSLLAEVWQVSNNRSLLLRVYAFNNPAIGSSRVLNVQTSFNAVRIGAYICSYSGSTGFGAAASGHVSNETEQTVSLNLTQAFSIVALGGLARVSSIVPVWSFDAPAFLTDSFHTGTNAQSEHIGMGLGHAAAASTGALSLTGEATSVMEMALIAVEVLSETGFVSSATASTVAAPFLVPATATAGITEPTILIGSIPPTQVLWQGNIFFSSKMRVVNVLFLTTKGPNWVQPNSVGGAQTISVTVKRRKAYLIPQ